MWHFSSEMLGLWMQIQMRFNAENTACMKSVSYVKTIQFSVTRKKEKKRDFCKHKMKG